MPVVSHSVMPRTPTSTKRCTQPNTSASGTSPSMGQPNTHDSDTFTATLAPCARATTCASAANDCSCVMRRLARLWVALTDMTRFSSSVRDSMARSAPRRLGTNAVYTVPGRRVISRITISASFSAGMAVGDVNEVTSILDRPADDSALHSAILSSVGTKVFSICRPSRRPTSCMWMRRPVPCQTVLGSFIALLLCCAATQSARH